MFFYIHKYFCKKCLTNILASGLNDKRGVPVNPPVGHVGGAVVSLRTAGCVCHAGFHGSTHEPGLGLPGPVHGLCYR